MQKPILRLSYTPLTTSVVGNTEWEEITEAQAASIYGGAVSEVNITETPNYRMPGLSATTTVEKVSNNWSQGLQTVLDQPPAVFPRWLLVGGMTFCFAFGAWTWLGQIEEVGHATGRLIPKGEVYKIHPVGTEKVTYITVKEGEAVKAGQVLVEMDTAIATNEVRRLQQLLASYQVELSQKQGLVARTRLQASTRTQSAAADLQAQEAEIAAAKAKAVTTRQLLAQLQAQLVASQQRLERLEPIQTTVQQRLAELQADVTAHQARIKRLKPLVQQGAVASEQLFTAEQALRDRIAAITQSELAEDATARERLFEAEQALRDRTTAITQNQGELQQTLTTVERLQAGLAQKQAEYKTSQLETQQQIQQVEVEVTQMKAKIAETRNQLYAAMVKVQQGFFSAPVDGIVSSLGVRNPGEVVQPGQTIAEVAPETAPLVLSASLPNQEAAFVKPGMPVQIKLEAYPYQDYGVVPGTVVSISPDTKQDRQLGAVYQVEVALDSNFVKAKRQNIKFKAGQTASADIIIRHRRIADILLSPIKQLQKGGIDL